MTHSMRNPPGWPASLKDYTPGKHHDRTIFGVTLYPYDTTPGRVCSWVCIRSGKYMGLIGKSRGQTHFQIHKKGVVNTDFAHTLHDAVRRISRPTILGLPIEDRGVTFDDLLADDDTE